MIYVAGIAVNAWIVRYDTIIAAGVAAGVACIVVFQSIAMMASSRGQSKGI